MNDSRPSSSFSRFSALVCHSKEGGTGNEVGDLVRLNTSDKMYQALPLLSGESLGTRLLHVHTVC